MYLTLFAFLFSCMGMMLCVPFLTLFERKVLSYSQNRKGPNKVSLFGLFQPLVDGVKLMMKESGSTLKSKKIMFFISPLSIFCLSLCSILVLSKTKSSWVFNFNFIFFLVVVSCKIFPLFFSGVASNSKYSTLGSFRGAAQVIAYEVNAVMVILSVLVLTKTFSSYYLIQSFNFCVLFVPCLVVMWLFCIMCETNRAPFDFAEGESELVSGYNTEYSGLKFTFLFLAEYGKIIIMSVVTSILFFMKKLFVTLMMVYFFLALRSSFPRFRYDLLMMFSWKVVLPMVLVLFSFCLLLMT